MSELSVIMATYNENLNFLKTGIDSVLNQTFQDFEFFIVIEPEETNMDFLQSISMSDNRLKILKNTSRLGVAGSRNRAIMESSGEFIAIIDGDDYCDSGRFEKQLLFLKKNPNISIVGSNMYLIDHLNNIVGERKYPESHEDIRKNFLLTMSVANPTVIMRRKDLQEVGLFNIELSKAEDFELWLRFLAKDKIMHNLQENLLYYRTQTKQNEKRGALHWKNNYTARKKYSKFIWPFHVRFASLFFFFVMSHTPGLFLDTLLNMKIVSRIKNIRTGSI